MSDFGLWLQEEIERQNNVGVDVDPDVEDIAVFLNQVAIAYWAIRAYGMHLRCWSVEVGSQTADSAVAATFVQSTSLELVQASQQPSQYVEYVGSIEEILEIDYGRHCVMVLVCSWVKAHNVGSNPTTMHDYRFTMVNLSQSSSIPLGT
jgi:hypothetical protein